MTQYTGSLSLANLRANRFTSVAEFGLDNINQVIQAELAAHSRVMGEAVSELCALSTDRLRISGGSDYGEMKKGTEFTRPETQKVGTGGTVGFPMDLYQIGLGWTRKALQRMSVGDMAEQVDNAMIAHRRAVMLAIKTAVFTNTNTTYPDRLAVPHLDLPLKAFCNADSFPIPAGPNGETFDSATHDHYDGEASYTADFLSALILDVNEHGHGEDMCVYINIAQEAATRGFSGFVPASYTWIVDDTTRDSLNASAPRTSFDFGNRFIGTFSAAKVYVKPWIPANYVFCFARGDSRKPLVMRTADGGGPSLIVAAEHENYPLQAEYMESEFGVSVWTRTNGAVLYIANATYAIPTLT